MEGHCDWYVTIAVFRVLIDTAVAASFAAIFDFRKFGIAIAAIIRIMPTTIRSSMRENPRCREPLDGVFLAMDLILKLDGYRSLSICPCQALSYLPALWLDLQNFCL
jgi:hypothetical protein